MADRAKIFKMSLNSSAQVTVTNNSAFLVGSEKHFVKVNDKGTTIYGPLSIVAGTDSIKTGGMFTQLPNLIKMIPSTMVTPIPDQIPSPPLNVAYNLAEDVSYFALLLA